MEGFDVQLLNRTNAHAVQKGFVGIGELPTRLARWQRFFQSRSQFGWHIIRLDDVRDTTPPPPFEQVKPQLGQVVLAKKFRAYGDELAKAAKIEKKLQ